MGTPLPPPPLDAIVARYEAVVGDADVRWHEEVATRPIYDAPWEQELTWIIHDAAHFRPSGKLA
jgi:hypothetical protein